MGLRNRFVLVSLAAVLAAGASPVSMIAAWGQPAQDQPMQGPSTQGQPTQDQSTQGQPMQGQPPEGQPMQGQEAAPPSDLTRQEDTAFRLAFVAPGTDWRKYKTIHLRTLEIPPDVRDASSGQRTRGRESFVLGDREVAALQDAYNTAMRNVLTQAGYTFVDTPQADTLIVAPQVLRIRLNAPIASSRFSGRQRTYSRGAGSITIGAVLADGDTSNVIAQVADHSVPSNMWRINNHVTNLADARTAFNRWARSLRDTLRSGGNEAR